MGLGDRLADLVSRAGRAARAFTASTGGGWTPAAPGFEPVSPDRPNQNPEAERKLRSRDALLGRTTYYAGPSQDRYSAYPGTGLEPQQIWNLILLRNQGYPDLWTQLCEQVLERDGHLGSVFDTRRLSVIEKPFRFHPARRGDELADVVAKFTERVVDGIDAFDQTLEDLLSAPAYGYALSEIVWTERRVRVPTMDGEQAVMLMTVPDKIQWVHWKHVRFDRWTDEPYLWLNQGQYSLPPCKFIFHDAAGTGLIEKRGFMGSCVWLSAAKRWSERDWLVYAKLFGIPNILGKYPNELEEYEAHRDKYVQFLKDWGEGIPALLPDELVTEITREPGGRGGDLHGSIIGWANTEMSKRVLGSTLTVEQGSSMGSFAMADTHRDAPYMRARADARKLCGTLRRDLNAPIVYLNREALAGLWGVTPEALMDSVAKCSFRIEREMTPVDRQQVYEGAVNNLGLEVDEDQYRDEMGLDAPRPGGKMLRGQAVQIGAGGLAPALDAAKDGADPAPKPESENDAPALPPAKRSASEPEGRKTPRGRRRK